MPYLLDHHLSFHSPRRRWPSSSAVRTEFCLIDLWRMRDRSLNKTRTCTREVLELKFTTVLAELNFVGAEYFRFP